MTPCTRSGGRPAEKDPVTGANATKCFALTVDGGFQAEEWSFIFLSSCGVFLLAARLFLQQSPGSGPKSEPDEGATLAVWWVLGPLLPPPVAVCIPRFDAAADPPAQVQHPNPNKRSSVQQVKTRLHVEKPNCGQAQRQPAMKEEGEKAGL